MTHYLGLVMVNEAGSQAPISADTFLVPTRDERILIQLRDILEPFKRNAKVDPYIIRRDSPNRQSLFAATHPLPAFAEDGNEMFEQTVSPFPNFDSYSVGGQFAGSLIPSHDGAVKKVEINKLMSIDHNSIKANAFKKHFCPHILIAPSKQWMFNQAGLGVYDADKYQRRIMRTIDANPEHLLVLIDFNVEQATKDLTLVDLLRR